MDESIAANALHNERKPCAHADARLAELAQPFRKIEMRAVSFFRNRQIARGFLARVLSILSRRT